MSIADERRASGQAMVDARRQSGKNMASERRASGKAFRDDLRALADSETENRTLSPAREMSRMPPARGVANYTPPATGSTGGGVASPLTEAEGTREYYPPAVVIAADGYFIYSVRSVKKLTLNDSNGGEVVVNLEEPDYGEP